jgi:hypothetical protein
LQSIYGKKMLSTKAIKRSERNIDSLGERQRFVEPSKIMNLITNCEGRVDSVSGKGFSALTVRESILNSHTWSSRIFKTLSKFELELTAIPEFAWIAPHTQIIGTKIS